MNTQYPFGRVRSVAGTALLVIALVSLYVWYTVTPYQWGSPIVFIPQFMYIILGLLGFFWMIIDGRGAALNLVSIGIWLIAIGVGVITGETSNTSLPTSPVPLALLFVFAGMPLANAADWFIFYQLIPDVLATRQERQRIMDAYHISANQADRVRALMNTLPSRWPTKARDLFQTSIARTFAQQGDAIESVLAEFVREEDYQREVVDGLPQV